MFICSGCAGSSQLLRLSNCGGGGQSLEAVCVFLIAVASLVEHGL